MDTGTPSDSAAYSDMLRARYRSGLPARLEDLVGPTHSVVVLPLHVAWSGQTSFCPDRPQAWMSLYRTAPAWGQRRDLIAFLDRRLLIEQWPVLHRLISLHIRVVWEEAFPGPTRTATTAG